MHLACVHGCSVRVSCGGAQRGVARSAWPPEESLPRLRRSQFFRTPKETANYAHLFCFAQFVTQLK